MISRSEYSKSITPFDQRHFNTVGYKIFYFGKFNIFPLHKASLTTAHCLFVSSSLAITDDTAVELILKAANIVKWVLISPFKTPSSLCEIIAEYKKRKEICHFIPSKELIRMNCLADIFVKFLLLRSSIYSSLK